MPVNSDDLEGAMTMAAVAERLHVSEATVKRMVRDREIEYLRIGTGRGRIYVSERAFLEYLARSTSKAQS
jgi:excisionase family DNA binding protein